MQHATRHVHAPALTCVVKLYWSTVRCLCVAEGEVSLHLRAQENHSGMCMQDAGGVCGAKGLSK